MRYAVLDGNMDRLRKKMTRIGNKCRKFGCDFSFSEVGEEFREVEDGDEKYVLRYVLVDVEGHAVVNGWKFIASVEHTDKGNIISKVVTDVEVPERYYDIDPVCEHCGTNRRRKDTFIVMNEETGEFKMVGKSCLKDFTGGMSAEAVTAFIAGFDEVIKGETPMEGYSLVRYMKVREFLHYVAETIRHFGYVKRASGVRGTADRAGNYYAYDHGWLNGPWNEFERERCKKEMEMCGFNPDSPEAVDETEKALEWLNGQEDNSNYMHNLKVACSLEYDNGHDGVLASLFPTYKRELAYEAERRAREAERLARIEAEKVSEWVGNVGDKVDIRVRKVEVITAWVSSYGYRDKMVYVYKITDDSGNIFTWKTGTDIPEDVKGIRGTVKEHKEFRGVKQTEVTRCRCA